ncbi:tyrosine-type recombinase/integrase (plasmid) [Clavibacter michiganensis]|uniref:tyrosine-type recombinase/integrase n=1 Tax=Clavibacter michiganensis TaxID=28447 RepID=UPI003DA074AB
MQNAVSMFCDYVTDLRYKWVDVCELRFSATPSQVVFEWNAVTHRHEHEGRTERRALRPNELQLLFDVMDEQAVALQRTGKKGWQAALRDAAMFKICYAFGLRRAELAGLALADIGANPHTPEFGGYGVIYVRHGKGSKGSAHKRRSVLTYFDWSVEVLRTWVDEQRPLFPASAQNGALWPSERQTSSSLDAIGRRFTRYREIAGLPRELTLHALRHSYVTHLIEAGIDPFFVQEQVGHSHASTTSIYTSVSSDFRTRTLKEALDATTKAIMERRAT